MNNFFDNVTDIHLDLNEIRNSVLFPGFIKAKDLSPEEMVYFEQVVTTLMRSNGYPEDGRFKIRVGKVSFRVQRMDKDRWALRLVPHQPPAIETLGLKDEVIEPLIAPYHKGGIILVVGLPGEGKTTTISSAVRTRLIQYGGYCLTIEDPPEYDLTGFHGNGYCEQVDANGRADEALFDALRCFPAKTKSLFFFGEVREGAEANHLLRIALSGHLVMTTIHGKDALSGIRRMIDLAGEIDPAARINFSQVFQLSVYQEIQNAGLVTSFIRNDHKIRSAIATGNFDVLKTEERAP